MVKGPKGHVISSQAYQMSRSSPSERMRSRERSGHEELPRPARLVKLDRPRERYNVVLRIDDAVDLSSEQFVSA